jgi:hypothetical protein
MTRTGIRIEHSRLSLRATPTLHLEIRSGTSRTPHASPDDAKLLILKSTLSPFPLRSDARTGHAFLKTQINHTTCIPALALTCMKRTFDDEYGKKDIDATK